MNLKIKVAVLAMAGLSVKMHAQWDAHGDNTTTGIVTAKEFRSSGQITGGDLVRGGQILGSFIHLITTIEPQCI